MSAKRKSVTVPVTFAPFQSPDARRVPDDSNAVDVAVLYDLGGMNLFTYKSAPRGYYAILSPVKIGGGFTSIGMFDPRGGKVFLKAANRFSAAALEVVAAPILSRASEIASALAAGDRAGAFALLTADRVQA